MMKMVVLDGYTLNPGDLDWRVLDPFGSLTVYPSSQYIDEAEQYKAMAEEFEKELNKNK